MAIKDVILGYAKGDKGDRGPQGEKGATGATGPKGEPGNIADAQITDTEGLDVAKGQKTTAQKLFDAIANRIVTKLVTNDALTKKLADYMLKGMMSNTNVNNTGTVPTSALMYSMFEQINSDLNPSTMITGGVIDYAESLPICFRTISVNERTSQTPSTLNYGTGYIEKSGETDIVIILHNVVTKETYTKRRSNIGWGDWETYALKSDLALLSFTWTGEATNYIDTSSTIDGYKPIAITGLNPTGLGTTEALRYFRFNKNNLRAIASFTAKTVTSCIFDVLCIRI